MEIQRRDKARKKNTIVNDQRNEEMTKTEENYRKWKQDNRDERKTGNLLGAEKRRAKKR